MIGDGDCGEIGGLKIGRENRSTRREPAPAPLCLSQIPYEPGPPMWEASDYLLSYGAAISAQLRSDNTNQRLTNNEVRNRNKFNRQNINNVSYSKANFIYKIKYTLMFRIGNKKTLQTTQS
jgi:hypothetical protein